MSRLKAHQQALYELRFSPMCKPAGEVANLTRLESHTTRARMMLLWRVAQEMANWRPREVELIYQSTLDSISEAFDVFHYPISQYMLDARADIWEAGLAPEPVEQAVSAGRIEADRLPPGGPMALLAGEIAQLDDQTLLAPIEAALQAAGIKVPIWVALTGALAYALGAKDLAKAQAAQIIGEIAADGTRMIIADGPETAWALTKVYPALGLELPPGVTVKLLSEVLAEASPPGSNLPGQIFIHDSRPACLIAEAMAGGLSILPGYTEDEAVFGLGAVYEAPRRLIEAWGGSRVFGTWTRSLAKSSGADDGLWLTYPKLATGLANQRLDYAEHLGATAVVTDSPLAADWLKQHRNGRGLAVKLLAELVTNDE